MTDSQALRRYKYRLLRRCKANHIPIEPGYRWRSARMGKPAVATLQRYQRFVGIPQTGSFGTKTLDALYPGHFRKRIAALAHKELGAHETSANWSLRIRDYLAAVRITFPTAWCAAFVTFIVHKAGYRGDLPSQTAWVPSWAAWARSTGHSIPRVKAGIGDIVCINWTGSDSTPDHIAIVTGNAVLSKRLTTVGGNEGDAVREAWRPYSQAHTVIRLNRFAKR